LTHCSGNRAITGSYLDHSIKVMRGKGLDHIEYDSKLDLWHDWMRADLKFVTKFFRTLYPDDPIVDNREPSPEPEPEPYWISRYDDFKKPEPSPLEFQKKIEPFPVPEGIMKGLGMAKMES
jgi:hypothetical protein